MNRLISKYNVAGPRYTSYPTVPHWDIENFNTNEWAERLKVKFNATNSLEGLSIYIHLPFCESLCTFCGCHKRITKRHEVELPYIEAILNEWQMYINLFEATPIIKELHLGGGTPTFFSPENLKYLIDGIFSQSIISKNAEFSFEGHPNNTTYKHLKTLRDLGFSRVSFGVQDYDSTVQKAINRIQPFEKVVQVTLWAKQLGYTSVSHDIIYGLPFQNLETIKKTIKLTSILNPDRISFYSYAHVPWLKGNGQRGFDENNLPKNEEKRNLYEKGKELFIQNGYVEIGMDHFAKPTDKLYDAWKNNMLHRNFMGYSASKTTVMIGLGASSIGDTEDSFSQNEKNIEEYMKLVSQGKFPICKGHIHSQKDLVIRQAILDIICHFTTHLSEIYSYIPKDKILERLEGMINDELLVIKNDTLNVTEKGKTFVRNICMAFDEYLQNDKPEKPLFSMTI